MKHLDVPEVTSSFSNLLFHDQLHWVWPKWEIQGLTLWKKGIRINILGFEYIFRYYPDTKTTKILLAIWTPQVSWKQFPHVPPNVSFSFS